VSTPQYYLFSRRFFQSSVANSDKKDMTLPYTSRKASSAAVKGATIYGTAEQAAEKCRFGEESSPQRLKPNSLHSSYVRPKGRTLQRSEFFRSL